MAVVIETTLGDLTVDLFVEHRPQTCLNFLKLCSMKYYNFNLFHMVRSGFIAQTGDPTGEGSGGQSIWGMLLGPDKGYFSGETMPKIRHTDAGLLSMVCVGDSMVGSQFFFTLASNLDSLDGVHCVIGVVTEGHEVLRKFNDIICDETYRPYQDVRITHTVVLEDPFNDPPGLIAPCRSPSPTVERLACGRIAPDEDLDESKGKSAEELTEIIEEKEAKARATILEIVGDLPDADIAPPENVLFVCKLNPVTTDDDLEIIFSRFGKIVSCEVIRDKKTGDSLQYAFIEFGDKKSCESAYFKMDNVLIDDRRIHVDFSQSVSKIKWLGKGRGVKHITDNGPKNNDTRSRISKRSRSRDRHYDDANEHRKNSDNKNRREHKKRSRSRSRIRESPSRRRSEKDRKRDHSPNEKYKRDRHHEDNSKTHKKENNTRDKSESDRNHEHKVQRSSHRKHENYERQSKGDNNVNGRKRDDKHSSNSDKHSTKESKSKSNTNIEKSSSNKREKSPGTPPKEKLKNDKLRKDSKKLKKATKKEGIKETVKKKRKPSTSSSDTESSDSSSSSSESSSSGESDQRKNKSKRKRKQSTSSSSSSTTTSSSESSSSSSSDSSSKKKQKRKKVLTKKPLKKVKKK